MTGHCLKFFIALAKGLHWKREAELLYFFFLSSYSGYDSTDSKRIKMSAELIGTTSAPAPQEIVRAEHNPGVEGPKKLLWKKPKPAFMEIALKRKKKKYHSMV